MARRVRIAWRFPLAATLIAAAAVLPLCVAAQTSDVGRRSCAELVRRVDAVPPPAALFLRSYDGVDDATGGPALRTAAFTYDNALAVVALIACGQSARAGRIGEALRLAATGDRRLRNAYRAGPLAPAVLANGWWDAQANRWAEDAYQAGTATGNVAWAALALLVLHDASGDARWLEAARGLAGWIVVNTADARGDGGFSGGVHGFDGAEQKLLWKSTEHNIDAAALFERLDAAHAAGDWRDPAQQARHFVAAQWDARTGRFLVGTQTDGVTANRQTSALDVQLWPLLLRAAPADWRRAIAFAEREHGVRGGFDFNADRDGLWLEGTAQAALVYRRLGRDSDADALLATIAAQIAPSGFVYATREPRITTGLALASDSSTADFYYYRRPHLGATAWAVLAARRWNPFAAGGK